MYIVSNCIHPYKLLKFNLCPLTFHVLLHVVSKTSASPRTLQSLIPPSLGRETTFHFVRRNQMAELSSAPPLFLRLRCRQEQLGFGQRLLFEERRHRDLRVPKGALQSPFSSAFMTHFDSVSDQALMMKTELDHCALQYLLECSTRLFLIFTPYFQHKYVARLIKIEEEDRKVSPSRHLWL